MQPRRNCFAAAPLALGDVEEVVLITGLSGAGRSQAANTLEDLGWFVIDNMPVELVHKVADLGRFTDSARGLALVVGSGHDMGAVSSMVAELREAGINVRVMFLDAATDVLVRRYGETRRRHPLRELTGSTESAIHEERKLLAAVRQSADLFIDTSDLNVHDLRRRVTAAFGDRDDGRTKVNLVSFGYKYGVPGEVDLLFDCRFLDNPYWDPELRDLSGLDEAVQQRVMGSETADGFMMRTRDLIEFLVPAYENDGKSFLTIAFGCTGGRHRSVTMAEQCAGWLREAGREPQVRHRDLGR